MDVLHPLTFTSWPGLTWTPLTWGSKKEKAGLGSLVPPVEGVGEHGQWVTMQSPWGRSLEDLVQWMWGEERVPGQPSAEARYVCAQACAYASACAHIHGGPTAEESKALGQGWTLKFDTTVAK